MSLTVLGHGQPGVGIGGGAIVNHDDRMRRIDLGVPAADGAVDRVEDQPGRRGSAMRRDHKVIRRIVDDASGVAARPDPQRLIEGRRCRPRDGDRLREHVAGAAVKRGQPGGKRVGHNETPIRHRSQAPTVQVGIGEMRKAGLVAHQIGLLVAAEQAAVFQRFRPRAEACPLATGRLRRRCAAGAEGSSFAARKETHDASPFESRSAIQ